MVSMPSRAPFTVPLVSHSSEARNSSRWLLSHIALWDEQPKSTSTFCGAPRSAYSSLARTGSTCLSWVPWTISVGVIDLPTVAVSQPHVVVCGARRTPGPQVAPTGSDASISDHTLSAAPGSTWFGHITCRLQFASKSARDWVLNAAPAAGTCAGGAAEPPRT